MSNPHDLEEGDKILINTEGTTIKPWCRRDSAAVRITQTEPRYEGEAHPEDNGLPSSVDIEHGKIPESRVIKKICSGCDTSPVYHDKKEEWFCPFCEDG